LDSAGDINEEELEEAAEQEDPQDETNEWPCHNNDEGWIDKQYDKQKQELYSIS
jgi:hypothetical protein